MLKLRHHPQIDFPHSVRGSVQHKFAFAPVVNESDEILNAIDADKESAWELRENNELGLESYWSDILNDVRHDPEWNFTEED